MKLANAQMNAQNAVVKLCRVEAPEAELDAQVEFCAIQISATMAVALEKTMKHQKYWRMC
jgi:hypothetical protein